MSKSGGYKDSEGRFTFGRDNNDGSFRQDRLTFTNERGDHEHSWSKTSTDGQHKEGSTGENVPRSERKK